MSSLSRTEYRREEQRRTTESPFRETKWDRHLDTLLTDLNDSVGSGGGSQQRSLVPSGQVTESRGVPGSGDFHERREYVSPDQRTRVVQERYEHSNRGDGGGKAPASHVYESQPSAQYHRSHTTSTKHQTTFPDTLPNVPSYDNRLAAQYHQPQPPAAVQYQRPGPPQTSESHYQTVKTISSNLPGQPQIIEYIEEIPQPDTRRTEYRTIRSSSQGRDKSPTTYQYYETRPGVEKRTTKTVTEYRTQHQEPAPATPPAPVSPPQITRERTEYVESPAPGTHSFDGKPTTIRYVDKKPITIYHESKSGYASGPESPPVPAPVADKPPTVYYERIIERQPIIHYYGAPPPGAGAKRSTLPLSTRSTVTQQHVSTLPPGAPATVPGRICVSNRYETNNETNRWPTPGARRPSDDYSTRSAYDYAPSRRHLLRSPDTLPDYGRTGGSELVDDLRSEPDYARGYDPEPLWRGRAGSLRSDTGYGGRGGEPEPWGRRYGSMRASAHGRRSPPYAEVYRTGAELAGYGYSRPYQPAAAEAPSYRGSFARALSPVQPPGNNDANRPLTNYDRYHTANQAVTKQVYKSYSSDSSAPQTQVPAAQPPPVDGSRFKQNILELDSLLDDLDHARKKPGTNGVDPGLHARDGPTGTSTPYRQSNVQKTVTTTKYTSGGAPEPQQLTPADQLTALGLTGPRHSPSPNPLEGLDRSLVPELSEPPQAGTTRVTKYEYRSTNRRDVSPQPAPAPAPPPPETKTVVNRREYTSTTNTLDRPAPADHTDNTVVYNVYNTSETTVPPPGAPPAGVPAPVVPPTQPGSNTTINYHIYNYGTLGPDGQPVGMPAGGSAPPSESGAPPRGGTLPRPEHTTTTTTTYRERYGEQSPPPQQQPQPRSPDPGPDTTISNSYVYEKHSRGPTPQRQQPPPQQPPHTSYTTNTITKHYTIGPDGSEIPIHPGSAPDDKQYPRFPVDEPTHPGGTHKRTTTTTIERTHTHGSPFPARSPSPSPRRPQRDDGPRVPFPGSPRHHVDDIDTPRRVDELMAQIPDTPQDGTYPHGPRRRELTNGRQTTTTTHFTVHETEPLLEGQTKVTLDAKSGAVVPHTPTKPVSGLPVYYPPGSTEFKPKPESEMMFQSYESSGGGGKYRSKSKSGWKASGKSSSKSGSKESHAEGGAVIPICLPLCCGAACSVM